MSSSRIAGNIVLGILLVFVLFIFGAAFLIHSTLLNRDFIIRQVDKLDLAGVARDIAEEQVQDRLQDEQEFIKETAYDLVAEKESWLKEQFDAVAYTGYDFLLGKTDHLSVNIPVGELKENIRDAMWLTLQKYLAENAAGIPKELILPYVDDYLQELVDSIPPELLPSSVTGLEGSQLKAYFDTHYTEIMNLVQRAYQIPGLSAIILNQIQPYFDDYYNDLVSDFPDSKVINEDNIPSGIMKALRSARRYIGYFYTGFYVLIAVILLLVVGIILVNRNIRDIFRVLGIAFLVFGVIELAAVLFTRTIDFIRYASDIPTSLDSAIATIIRNSFLPLQWLSLGILLFGVVLLVLSFLPLWRTSAD